jgi:hypothetical protein
MMRSGPVPMGASQQSDVCSHVGLDLAFSFLNKQPLNLQSTTKNSIFGALSVDQTRYATTTTQLILYLY